MNSEKYLLRFVLSGVLAAGLFFAAGKPALADRDWGPGCRDRIENARARMDRDIARHGQNSREANRDLDRLEDARRWCRDHHADWDHAHFDVGVYVRP